MTDLTALGARATGLTQHLLTRAELEDLAGRDEPGLAAGLARTAKLATLPERAAARELEVALQQTLSRYLAILARWGGSDPVLEVFAAAQDLRSLRAMIRGAVQGAPPAQRLAGLIPTATLPRLLLEALAREPTPARVGAHLLATRHPDAGRLAALGGMKTQPDLLALDRALVQGFAARATTAARHGDEDLTRHVALQLDVSNAQAALALAAAHEVSPSLFYVEGGAFLSPRAFAEVAAAKEPATALQRALKATPLRSLDTSSAEALERSAFELGLRAQRRAARLRPLGSGPAMRFLLRLEAMARDVRTLAWGAALGAPAALVKPRLVTPWA